MSIKDLFDKKKTKPVVRKNKTDIATQAESLDTAKQKRKKEDKFIPQLDFSKPENFAFYGSAEKYYSDAFKTIAGTYPYDGSEEEIIEFRNGMNYVERYIFDNLYPKTNGYALFSADGWGTATTPTGEYGVPTVKEYIYVYGGPLSASSGMTQYKLKYSFSASNLYQPDIYDVIDENPAGRAGTRESNLKYELDRGNTVEFWLQKDAFDVTKTKKEVVFDLWNQTAYSAAGYGRLLVELSGNNDYTDGSPFFISVNSGSAGFSNTKIGTNITTASLSSWHHYALSFQNDRTANKIKVKFYVDGALNDQKAIATPLNEITGGLRAYIGSLQAPIIGGTGLDGAGKLSGSIDEFRYWKARRTSEDIGYNYFRPIRGGTNKKVSNATLGLYYKFNEGITATSSTDSSVLDYSGRIANGDWYGYGVNSRSTGSAIVLGGGYASEEKDPIIYSNNVLVSNLRSELEATGSWYDTENTNKMLDLFPSWMHDRAFETSDPTLKNMTQMMGVEFDKTFLLINRITELKKQNYFNNDQKAFPFIKQMLESYGLDTEDLLTAAEINEKILNNNDTQILEKDIQDVKNKLYQNLFNNLFFIYKSKGSEKSFRNIFRAIGLDDELIAIKIYADNTTYSLEDNYKNKLLRSIHVDNNVSDHLGGTMHQWYTGSNANSISYITGSGDKGLEDFLGFTAECKFILPHKTVVTDPNYFKTPFSGSSIFGMNSADSSDQTDLSYPVNNYANFNVLVEKLNEEDTTARFRISSSAPFPIPELTTSYYNKIYSNTQWSIAVSVKPTNEIGNIAPGSAETSSASTAPDYNYMVEFYGVNMLGERVLNEFYLTSAIDNSTALNFLRDPKRLYMGSHYTNYTGALVNRSDVKFDSLKYWNLHNDTASVKQHMIDQESYGRADSLEQINLYETGTLNTYIPKFKTLILNWNFNNLSASQPDGNFFIEDYTSGSATDETYGKYKGYFNKQHTGIGRFYRTGSTTVFDKTYLNSMQKQTPETTMASNMINILQRDDEKYEKDDKAVRYSLHFEKSPYEPINKEILNMFSTVLDFNNAIGSSVERYRQEYKSLENLRRIMFARFENEVNVEKFISYYRWFDHAVGKILEEFIPGSVKYEASLATLIQSHVLERNKYWTKFPTMEFKGTDPEAGMAGYEELNYDWKHGHAPETNKQAYGSLWWRDRASRERGLLSSSIAGVNVDREKIRMEIESFRSSSALFLAQSSSLPAAYIPYYRGKETALRRFTKPYKFSMNIHKIIHGGVNFNRNKSYEYTFNALYPGGPINTTGGRLVPQNILLAFENEAYNKPDIKDVFDPNKKEKVFGKVIHGRNYGDGTGYANTDMNYAFPFNVYRSVVTGGYGDLVNDGYATGTIITNLHSDTYGSDLEVPMQGPFTEKWVGGLQARHAEINTSSSFGNFKRLDDYSTRPEAWRLLLDRCPINKTGAIGMAGADYPWPTSIADIEAAKLGAGHKPYPMTSSGKAHFYRDEYAKRPVNIRNIRTITGAISHGNYRHNYEVVHSVGSNQNPRAFMRDTPVLPFQISPGRNVVYKLFLNGSTNATNGQTVTLSDGVATKTLTFKTTPTEPDHIAIGAAASTSLANLLAVINLSQSWGLKGYDFNAIETAYLTNVNYQGTFTNVAQSTTWTTLEIGLSGSSPDIGKTGDITNVLTIRNIFRNQYGHVYTTGATRYENPHANGGIPGEWDANAKYDYDYSVGYLTGSGDYANKTIIKSRFAAPGGIETDTAGYRDFRGDEYSAYSPVPYRNLRVIRPDQATHDIVPDTTGTTAQSQGGPGIRVFDQSGRDIGIASNLARHTARFGRDSLVFPPAQYRQEYNLNRSFIGYGGEAVYRGNKSLQGWWRLDNYDMLNALTGNIDSSTYNRSYPFDTTDQAPSVFIDSRIFAAAGLKRFSTYTGPSYFVQTASFLMSTGSTQEAYPIGPASLWESIIGYGGSKRFTFAAWVFRGSLSIPSTTYPRIFDFGEGDVAFSHDQTAGDNKLTLIYRSATAGHGAETRFASTATGSMKEVSSKDQWVHVAVSADLAGTDLNPTASTLQNGVEGPRVKFYINGQKVDTLAADTGSADSNGRFYGINIQPCYIGNRSTFDRPWSGQLADAAVWDQAIPEEDIVAIYNAAKKSKPQPQYLISGSSTLQRLYGFSGPGIAGKGPGQAYNEVPSLHKVHRNSLNRVHSTPQEVVTQQMNSAWWPDAYAYDNAGNAGITNNSSSINHRQWSVASDTRRKMIFSFWIKDMIRDSQQESRNIFSLNTSLTGTQAGPGFSENAQAKQVFSVQLEESNTAPRRLAVTFGDGSNSTAVTSRRTWFTENQVISKSVWTHVLVATDGYVSGATIANQGTDADGNSNWNENPLCGVCVWVNGNRQILRRNNYGGNVYGTMVDKISTQGGGYFNIGGGMYQHLGANSWTMRPNNMYIDEFAMWQGTSTGSLVSSSIPGEVYNSGGTHNLKKTTLGEPFLYYKFGDDPADPQTGSMTSQSIIHDQSVNRRHATVTIDGQSAGRMIMISASVPEKGAMARTTTYNEVFATRKEYDNYYIQHQIPRSDTQYAWITASFDGSTSASIKVGYAPFNTWDDGLDNSGNNPYSDLLTASFIGEYYSSNNRILAHYTNVYSNKSNTPAVGKLIQPYGITVSPTRAPNRPMYSGTKVWKKVDPTYWQNLAGVVIDINTVSPGRTMKTGSLPFEAGTVSLPFAKTSSLSLELFRDNHGRNIGAYYNTGREEGAINPHELTFRTGPSASVMLNPAADRLNLYLTRINGPYGGANFTFIRNQDNPNLQASRQFNFYTTIKSPSDSLENSGSVFSRRSDRIQWYDRVSPVTSKYKTLTYGIGTTRTIKNKFNQDVEIDGTSYFRTSFANQKNYFNNEKLNIFLGLDRRENLTFYDKFKDLYLDGGLESELSPIQRVQFLRYSEEIYPSSLNMYSRFVRQRVNYDMENWRSAYIDRIKRVRWQYQPRPKFQYRTEHYSEVIKFPLNQDYEVKIPTLSASEVRCSMWPMDTANLYLSGTSPAMCLADNRMAYGRSAADWCSGSFAGGTSKIIYRPAGRLLNNYTHWHGAGISSADMYAFSAPLSIGVRVFGMSKFLGAVPQFALNFITASCLYALKNVSFHSHSVYAWNRPNVCFYNGNNNNAPAKYPNPRGDRQLMAYNTQTAYKYNGYGDAPYITDETAGSYTFNTSSNAFEFVSASMPPFYNDYEAFSEDIRTKNKDMSVIPEFRISSHLKAFSNGAGALETELPDMFEIPGARNTETMPDGSDLSSLSTSGSFYKIYSNSDFLENFEILKNDHKDFMEPTTLTLRCSAIKKFMPYKGFYPAERTVQLFDQFMDSYAPAITGSQNMWGRLSMLAGGSAGSRFGGTGSVAYGAVARPVITPLFSPGILFNSIKSGLGVDFPILEEGGILSPKPPAGDTPGFGFMNPRQGSSTSVPRWNMLRLLDVGEQLAFGPYATQNPALTANKLTASVSIGPRYADLSGGIDYYPLSTGGSQRYTLEDRYTQIVGSNRPGTLTWSKRIPFEAIIRPEDHMAGLKMTDMFVNDAAALISTGKEVRYNTGILSGVMPAATLNEPNDAIYTLMADNFIGAVPDFFLEDGELATITSKKESELDLYLKSGEIYATRLRMRRSMNQARSYKWDLQEIFHNTASIEYSVGSFSAGLTQRINVSAGDATENYILEEGQTRQIKDYDIFQDPIRQRGLFETLTMYNRPGAFGPPVTGRDTYNDKSWAKTFKGHGEMSASAFHSWTSSYGTNAVLDSSNGFNPAFTPPYYDGHAVVDIIFRATSTREHTIAEIMERSETQAWRFDPGWLVRRMGPASTVGPLTQKSLATTASFTLIPGEIYYDRDPDGNLGAGVTGTLGPGNPVRSGSWDPWSSGFNANYSGSLTYGGAPYAGQHINFTSMQLDNCINIKLLGKVPATTTDNEGNLTVRSVPGEEDKVWVIQPKWETPILNFKDSIPYPQHSISGSTTGIDNLNNRSALVGATGMWHQFGRIPQDNEGVYLEMLDIPKNWLDGHWSLHKNMNRGSGFPGVDHSAENESTEVFGSYGYNTPYTASAYDRITDSSEVKSLKTLLGFKSSADGAMTLQGPASAISNPKVKIGQLANSKIVSEAVIAIPFIEKGKRKYFFEIDKYFIDIARAERTPPAGVPDAGDSIKDMVEKMERYVLPPSMDFVTYPEITPFSMYIFEFTHEFSKQDLANMWQNIAPNSARTFEMANAKIRHDLNQDELMGFALAKSDETFMKEVQWMVFKVKQKNMVSYDDKIAGKKPPKLSFKLASPMQLMPNFSKFKIRRVKLQNNALKMKTVQITPTFRFGRSLTEDKADMDLSFNWPYDYFSIIECAKIRASIALKKPHDVEPPALTPIGPAAPGAISNNITNIANIRNVTQAQAVKASTATRVPKAGNTVLGTPLRKVSVIKKSNLSMRKIKGLTFLKK